MKLTIGAFHRGASRLRIASARLTRRASKLFRARGDTVFLADAICRSIEPIYHLRAHTSKRDAGSFDGLRRLGIVFADAEDDHAHGIYGHWYS
jgi:hypothetical protein